MGLSKLLCLRLPGCPASDMVEGTVAAWIDALTFNRAWDQERDAPRIRYAFRVLGSSASEWPVPADLMRSMPPVQDLAALPAKVVSDEVAQQNIAKIRSLLSDATCPIPDAEDV